MLGFVVMAAVRETSRESPKVIVALRKACMFTI